MKIAILGGTGSIGEGFALRWAQDEEIIIGSRTPEKAKIAADIYLSRVESCGFDMSGIKISGLDNHDAAKRADLIVLTVMFEHVLTLIEDICDALENKILVTPVVPMKRIGDHFVYSPPPQGSAALAIKEAVPTSTRVVSVYHNIAAGKLKDMECEMEYDAVICSDDEVAKKILFDLTHEIGCLRPLDGGPLAVSNMVESITPLLLNLAQMNGFEDVGIRFS
jgi:hypothetical protein